MDNPQAIHHTGGLLGAPTGKRQVPAKLSRIIRINIQKRVILGIQKPVRMHIKPKFE